MKSRKEQPMVIPATPPVLIPVSAIKKLHFKHLSFPEIIKKIYSPVNQRLSFFPSFPFFLVFI